MSKLIFSPNSFIAEIFITLQNQNIKQATFAIKNILGQIVYNSNSVTPNYKLPTKLDLIFLAKGIYLLELNMDGKLMVKKIVKE